MNERYCRVAIRLIVTVWWVPLVSMGCAVTPRATLLNTRAEPVYQKGQLVEMAFVSEVEAFGIVGEQLRYEVRLRDRKGRAVKSGDDQFMLSNGQVAASKTFIVHEDQESFGVRVSIPADQLELRNEHLPAFADAEIFYAIDQSLAKETCIVPISRVETGEPAPEGTPAKKVAPPKKSEPKKEGAPPSQKKEAAPKKDDPAKPKPKPKPKPVSPTRPDRPA